MTTDTDPTPAAQIAPDGRGEGATMHRKIDPRGIIETQCGADINERQAAKHADSIINALTAHGFAIVPAADPDPEMVTIRREDAIKARHAVWKLSQRENRKEWQAVHKALDTALQQRGGGE